MSKINYKILAGTFFVIIIISLAIDHLTIDLSALSQQSQNSFLSLKQVANFSFADFMLKAMNFLFVMLVFLVARGDRISDESKKVTDEKEKNSKDNNHFWFREFIIKPRRADILNFFDTIDSACDTFCKSCDSAKTQETSVASHEQNIKNTIRSLNESIQHFDKFFLQELSAVSESLSSDIRVEIDSLQDDLATKISTLPQNIKVDDLRERHALCKYAVIKKLMSFSGS